MARIPDWSPALVAAIIDHHIATDPRDPAESFSRGHVVAMLNVGCTDAQIREYLVHVFGDRKIRPMGAAQRVSAVDLVMGDLDSYR